MNKLQLPDTASATSTLTLDGDNDEERNSAMGYQQTLMVSQAISFKKLLYLQLLLYFFQYSFITFTTFIHE